MVHDKPIRVLLVDDHAMVRSGLRMFLMAFDDLELAGEASSGSDAVHLAGQLSPDIVLMDLIMPGLDGIQATREIRNLFPNIQVIALTSFPDPTLMVDAIQAGAISFLLKNISAADLANAIRAAYAGHSILSPDAAQALMQLNTKQSPPTIILTDREKDVLTLMVSGKSNAQIAAELVVSLSTIKFHVSSLLSKLGVKNRSEAVSLALQHHLIVPKQ